MSNTVIRKITAIAAAVAVTAAMSAVSFVNAEKVSNTSNITIEKNLKVSNPNLASVDGPGLTMNYAVSTVAPSADNGGVTITDADSHTGTVSEGVADGLSLDESSISWPIGTAVDASASGADNEKHITASVDVSKFSHAGIYRYKVTETVGTDTSETGAEGEIRYIDVYIINGASGLECSGVVMHDGATSEGKPSNKATFSDEEFETVNITLKKTVAGNMGDKTNQFPFAATTSDHGRYHYSKKAEAPTAINDNKKSEGNESTTLCHNEMYYISGLSHEAAVAYEETNNTPNTYQTAITGGTESAASAVAANGTKAMTSTDVDNAGTVVFTNSMDDVTPTGVILGYGAPILVLAAAGAIFFLYRRSKKANAAC